MLLLFCKKWKKSLLKKVLLYMRYYCCDVTVSLSYCEHFVIQFYFDIILQHIFIRWKGKEKVKKSDLYLLKDLMN